MAFSTTITSLSCLILMAGCDEASARTSTPAVTKMVKDPLEVDVELMEAGIRIAATNKSIDKMEHQVNALRTTPHKIYLKPFISRVKR